jgi:DNA-directed RNA polymerase subunit beta
MPMSIMTRTISTSLSTIKMEPAWDLKKNQTIAEAALLEFYKRMRPGDPPTIENAREYLESQLFDQRRYDLERVGRYKLNQRLQIDKVISRKHAHGHQGSTSSS